MAMHVYYTVYTMHTDCPGVGGYAVYQTFPVVMNKFLLVWYQDTVPLLLQNCCKTVDTVSDRS